MDRINYLKAADPLKDKKFTTDSHITQFSKFKVSKETRTRSYGEKKK